MITIQKGKRGAYRQAKVSMQGWTIKIETEEGIETIRCQGEPSMVDLLVELLGSLPAVHLSNHERLRKMARMILSVEPEKKE